MMANEAIRDEMERNTTERENDGGKLWALVALVMENHGALLSSEILDGRGLAHRPMVRGQGPRDCMIPSC